MLVWHACVTLYKHVCIDVRLCLYTGADAVASEKHFAINVPIECLWMWYIVMKMHDAMMNHSRSIIGGGDPILMHFDLTRIHFFGVEGKTELCWLWWDLEDSNIPGDGDRVPFN